MRYDEVSRDIDVERMEAVLEDHPEVRALWSRPHVVEIGGVNPVFHVRVQAVVEVQIRRRDPPEAEEAFRRLLGMGFGRHAARGAIANLFLVHLFPVLKEGKRFDELDFETPGPRNPCSSSTAREKGGYVPQQALSRLVVVRGISCTCKGGRIPSALKARLA